MEHLENLSEEKILPTIASEEELVKLGAERMENGGMCYKEDSGKLTLWPKRADGMYGPYFTGQLGKPEYVEEKVIQLGSRRAA